MLPQVALADEFVGVAQQDFQRPYRLGNDVLNAWLMSAVLCGGHADRVAGCRHPAVLGDQAVFAFTLLEIVNYMGDFPESPVLPTG